jgi:hypothetical protein
MIRRTSLTIALTAAIALVLAAIALVQSTLQSALKARHLNGNLVSNGQKFINALNAFLVKLHYTK